MRKTVEIPADTDEFETAQAFIEDLLDSAKVNREIASETLLIFEAVFGAALMQGIGRDTTLNISAENRLGSIYLKIGYEGKRFVPPEEDSDGMSPEVKLMESYADKISYSYSSGYNIIRISVRKSLRGYFISCGAGFLLALIAYAIISMFLDTYEQAELNMNYVFPLERLFANAVIMVGVPSTFFTLLKHASDTFIVSERSAGINRLQIKAIATSAFAVLLALGMSFLLAFILSDLQGAYNEYAGSRSYFTFADIVADMIPQSIFEAFDSASPIPIIVIALLVTYALCSAGKDFEMLKAAIDACYGLFSRMFSAVIAALPVGCFLSILDALLDGGFWSLIEVAGIVVVSLASICVLLITYAIRLRVRGVKVGLFVKTIMPLLRENRAIGSVIDAAPYNVRYCARHFGMNRSRLQTSLPVLAQINLDGNCYTIMMVAMFIIFLSGMPVSWVNIAVIAALVLFLSFGAPNQPGAILIGLLIVITYLGAFSLLCMAFYLEVFLGSFQNTVNVISCIVAVAEDEPNLTYR